MGFSFSRELLRSASKIAIAAAAAGFLAGCGGTGSFANDGSDGMPTMAATNGHELDGQDFVGSAAYWGAKYEANRGDTHAAINFARNLRMMGGARQAVAVMKEVVMKAPDDAGVLSEYGKALTAAGRAQDALAFLSRSAQINGDDWTTLSAYGVALDQTGSHTAARDHYQAALKLSPGNPTVESNMAMSYVLDGSIDQAELILRRLVARPDAAPQTRQNLAMVTAIKGNAIEAEQLAREDLAPPDASNNLAVLQQFDARNVAINAQPLPPPAPEPAAAPSVSAPVAPVHTPMAPIGDNSENPKFKVSSPALAPQTTAVTALPESPAVSIAPVATATLPAPMPTVTATPIPAPQSSQYTMQPIVDPGDPKPARTTTQSKSKNTNQATLLQTAPAQPAPQAPAAENTAAAPAASEPTPVSEQSYDVYRRPAQVEVANAAR